MTADALSFTEWFMSSIWSFFTSWRIPGTGMTPAHWLFFLLLAPVMVALIKKYIDKLSS